jgi:hypothetical protein
MDAYLSRRETQRTRRTVDRLISNEKTCNAKSTIHPTRRNNAMLKAVKFSKNLKTGPSQTNIDSLVGPVEKKSAYTIY